MSDKNKTKVLEITEKILELSGFKTKIKPEEKDDQILLNIDTDNTGLLIGKQGQNLKALERILQVIFYNQDEGKIIVVDVAGFREKRIARLEELAQRAIDEVLESGRLRNIEGLTAAERKFIHLKIAQYPNLESLSQGVGVDRVLIVKPKE